MMLGAGAASRGRNASTAIAFASGENAAASARSAMASRAIPIPLPIADGTSVKPVRSTGPRMPPVTAPWPACDSPSFRSKPRSVPSVPPVYSARLCTPSVAPSVTALAPSRVIRFPPPPAPPMNLVPSRSAAVLSAAAGAALMMSVSVAVPVELFSARSWPMLPAWLTIYGRIPADVASPAISTSEPVPCSAMKLPRLPSDGFAASASSVVSPSTGRLMNWSTLSARAVSASPKPSSIAFMPAAITRAPPDPIRSADRFAENSERSSKPPFCSGLLSSRFTVIGSNSGVA
ncbi:MAG: hypothetical protein KKA44_17910 [Alphaproteobacteria bacterium]|nr:hypothetical protein [Alphaproteobacteria bacterium]MBU1826829.1 hypothetical protein [Alphaproteobacteria bacterium]